MEYPTANITYAGMLDKGLTVQVQDSANPKTKWIVWKSDRENPQQENETYTDLQKYKLGETFGITYGEREKSFIGKEGNTVTYTERTIYKILPLVASPTAQPTQTPIPAKTISSGANTASQSESKDAFSRRLGIQGHINALLSNPTMVTVGVDIPISHIIQLAMSIEDEAEKQLNPSYFRQAVQAKAPNVVNPELPTIQIAEDIAEDAQRMESGEIDTDSIPF